jgi:uncharacterized protein YfdQ (DUF2303 family)
MEELSSTPDGYASIIEAARVGQIPTAVTSVDQPYVVVIPDGSFVQELDLSAWRDAPTRATGVAHPGTVASFSQYVKRFENDQTTIWVDLISGTLVAVIDDHAADQPGFGQHRAKTELQATPQWNHWLAKDGASMSQTEFAEHIEVGLDDIVEPDAATVLEIAQNFHAKTDVQFRSATRLDSGEQRLQYDEQIAATAGKDGSLTMPSAIKLGLEPFYGEDRFALLARLRFRISGGKLTLSYKLDRPDLVRQQAIESIAERLQGQHDIAAVFIGTPR